MPIYIAVEVARRELEGRLLLGLVAAERGHDVVLGKIPHRALLGGELDGWRLPPGILHLKSIASSPKVYERFDRLRAAGTLISVQDEEHGLAGSLDYEEFGRERFPSQAMPRVDLLCAWGDHDAEWIRRSYPAASERVVVTGSPRIDLWRPDMIQDEKRGATRRGGHIVVVSSITPFARNPFWISIHNTREGLFGPGFDGDDDPRELDAYDGMSAAYIHVKHLVRAVRGLLKAFPDRIVVFRPHHFEDPDAWVALLGTYPNLTIDASSRSRELVAGAEVVVHCGSSIALESSVAMRSVVRFCPVEGPWSDWAANRFGRSATTVDELRDVVGSLLADRTDSAPTADREFLNSLLAALDGPLAADRIVDEWERMLTPATSGRVEQIGRSRSLREQVRRPLRALRDAVRGGAARRSGPHASPLADKGPFAMEVEHKFPSLDVDALRADAKRLSDHLGRFQDVEIIQIGEREVLLRAAGR